MRASPYYGPQKVTFKPCVLWEAQGVAIEAIMSGLQYFSVQCGVTSTRMYSEGQSLSGEMDVDNTGRVSCCRGGREGKLGRSWGLGEVEKFWRVAKKLRLRVERRES